MNRCLWILVAMLLLAQGYGQLTPAPRFNLLRFFNSQIGASCQSVTETNDGRFMAVVNYTGECYLTKDAMVSLLYLQTPKWASGYYYQNAAFVTGMDSSGYVEWVHHFYSPGNDFYFYNSVTDAQQNLYLLGMLRDTVYIDDSVYTCPEAYNLLMVKIQPDGTIAWTKVIRSLEPGSNSASYLVMVNQSLVLVSSGGRLVVDGDTLTYPFLPEVAFTRNQVSIISRFDLYGNLGNYKSFAGGATTNNRIPVIIQDQLGICVIFDDTLFFRGDTMVYTKQLGRRYSAWYQCDTTFSNDTLNLKYVPFIYSQSRNLWGGQSFVISPDTFILNYSDSITIFGSLLKADSSGQYIVFMDNDMNLKRLIHYSNNIYNGYLMCLPNFNQYIYGFTYNKYLIIDGDTLSPSGVDYSSAIIVFDTLLKPISCKILGAWMDHFDFISYNEHTANFFMGTAYKYVAYVDSVAYDGTFANIEESYFGRMPFHGIVSIETDITVMGVHVFPNPASDHVVISGIVPEWVEIVDMKGRTLQKSEKSNELDISGLPAGLYGVRIWSGGKCYFQKLLKINS